MTRVGAPAPAVAGVSDAPLQSLVAGEIAAWYSKAAPRRNPKDEVLAFHRVLASFFQKEAIIPFRMPTMLADEAALRTWLAAHAAVIARELERLHGVVQMELHITHDAAAPAPASGRAYLEARRDAQRALEERAAAAREALADIVAEWRQRETRDGIRCYALVPRGREREFMSQVGASSSGLRMRVSGPWPPSEFLDPVLTAPA